MAEIRGLEGIHHIAVDLLSALVEETSVTLDPDPDLGDLKALAQRLSETKALWERAPLKGLSIKAGSQLLGYLETFLQKVTAQHCETEMSALSSLWHPGLSEEEVQEEMEYLHLTRTSVADPEAAQAAKDRHQKVRMLSPNRLGESVRTIRTMGDWEKLSAERDPDLFDAAFGLYSKGLPVNVVYNLFNDEAVPPHFGSETCS